MLFKKLCMLVLSLSLVVIPLESAAAIKKSYKRAYSGQSSSKQRLKYKVSKRGNKYYVKHKPRISQEQRIEQFYADQNYDGSGMLHLASSKALIVNQKTGEVVFAKNTNLPSPIASITKLMTAMVVLDAELSLDEHLYVSDEDVDYLKGTRSRLAVGTDLSRGDMLQLALMASENRAASVLARHYPGGSRAFVQAMNAKAQEIGLTQTHFVDATGLDSNNVSTAEDLAKLVQVAYQYPEIRFSTTSPSHEVYINGKGHTTNFVNTNGLVRAGDWDIGLSKTGFISEAGRCLVMQAKIAGEPMIIVLLDSYGKLTRIGDANRIRKWIEYNNDVKPTTTGQNQVTAGRIS